MLSSPEYQESSFGRRALRDRVSRVPFFESRYRVWDKEGQEFESDSESDSNQVWNSRPIPSPIPSNKPRDSEFRVWDPHFTYKTCKKCSNFKSETREIETSSPSPIPRLGEPNTSRPSPSPGRVLVRETRYFESETRDSGNSANEH